MYTHSHVGTYCVSVCMYSHFCRIFFFFEGHCCKSHNIKCPTYNNIHIANNTYIIYIYVLYIYYCTYLAYLPILYISFLRILRSLQYYIYIYRYYNPTPHLAIINNTLCCGIASQQLTVIVISSCITYTTVVSVRIGIGRYRKPTSAYII